MIENLFLIIGAIIIIIFIWLFWLRNSLMRDLIAVTQIQSILKTDFAKRRDIIPYLLESYKAASEPTDLWRKLLDLRSRTDSSQTEILELIHKYNAWSDYSPRITAFYVSKHFREGTAETKVRKPVRKETLAKYGLV